MTTLHQLYFRATCGITWRILCHGTAGTPGCNWRCWCLELPHADLCVEGKCIHFILIHLSTIAVDPWWTQTYNFPLGRQSHYKFDHQGGLLLIINLKCSFLHYLVVHFNLIITSCESVLMGVVNLFTRWLLHWLVGTHLFTNPPSSLLSQL